MCVVEHGRDIRECSEQVFLWQRRSGFAVIAP
jgi:hypothetical protein